MYTLYTQASQADINGVLNVKRMSCTTPQSTTPDEQYSYGGITPSSLTGI